MGFVSFNDQAERICVPGYCGRQPQRRRGRGGNFAPLAVDVLLTLQRLQQERGVPKSCSRRLVRGSSLLGDSASFVHP